MDVRVIRTKSAIRDAFFELLVDKEMQDITLTEISNKANVNRQTLYNYYSGVHDILDDLVNNLFTYYRRVFNEVDIINCFETPMIVLDKINKVIKDDLGFYRNLFTMKHNLNLKNMIGNTLRDIINQVFKEYKVFPQDKADIITTYFVHGLLGAYQYYFHHEYLDLDEFSRYIGDLVFGGLKKQINKK